MQRTLTADDAGCYLDNHRGHYISRDVVDFAESVGYIVGPLERWFLDCYEDHHHEDSYPAELVHELCDDAIAWLNAGQEERVSGQNLPPVIPDGFVWDFNDGDFGLYPLEETGDANA